MAKWLVQASQLHEMYCYDLEVVSLNPRLGQTWGAYNFCPSVVLEQTNKNPNKQKSVSFSCGV